MAFCIWYMVYDIFIILGYLIFILQLLKVNPVAELIFNAPVRQKASLPAGIYIAMMVTIPNTSANN